jgi:hypothetical protein
LVCHVEEEHGLRVFDDRVLRKVCGAKRGRVTADWGKLHNEELHDLYCSQNTMEPGYNGIGLCDTSSIASDILWYQLIPHYQP